jgi:hypothetical protein
MKKLLLIASCIVASVGLVAQSTGGSINFLTKVTAAGIDAKVTDAAGATVINTSGYLAQLYAGANEASLAPVGTAINFLSSGYLNGGKVLTPLAQGSSAAVQLRAWTASAGSSYEAASTVSTAQIGKSGVLTLTLGGDQLSPPAVPVNLVGLTSFQLKLVPEPSTLALGALAGLALLAIRRK